MLKKRDRFNDSSAQYIVDPVHPELHLYEGGLNERVRVYYLWTNVLHAVNPEEIRTALRNRL